MKQNVTQLLHHLRQLSGKLPFLVSNFLLFSCTLLCLNTQALGQDKSNNRLSDRKFSQNKELVMYLRNTSAVTLQLGGNTFFGDLGGNKGAGRPFIKDIDLKATRLFTGLSYSYFIDNGISVNAAFHYTAVAGADSFINKKVGHSRGRFDRNLSFKSDIYEFQTTMDLYPLQLINPEKLSRINPYFGAGIGVFHFNPKAALNGQWYELQPLHLEGQGFKEYPDRKDYKLTQMYIPLAVGVRYRLNNTYMLSLSALFRKTFTDYIDDASTTFIDPALFDKYLPASSASIAKQLYYRGPTTSVTPGPYRGYSGTDSYTSVFFSLTYLFNTKSLPSYHDIPTE